MHHNLTKPASTRRAICVTSWAPSLNINMVSLNDEEELDNKNFNEDNHFEMSYNANYTRTQGTDE